MKHFPAWIAIPLLLASCHSQSPSQESPTAPATIPSKQTIEAFWKDFRSALGRNDVAAVCQATRFPLTTDFSQVDGLEGVGTREGFARHFRTVFPESAVRTLLRSSSLEVRGSGGGPEESWSIVHNEPNEISEMEWSIIYVFSRSADGSIRLTAVHLAG